MSALRALGTGFDAAVVAAIDARLSPVAAQESAEIAMVAAADALLRSWLPE